MKQVIYMEAIIVHKANILCQDKQIKQNTNTK